MLTLMLLTVALSTAKPQAPEAETAPPNTCTPKESCRYVPSYVMRSDKGPVTVKMNGWSPIFENGLLPVFPGDTLVLAFDKDGTRPHVVSLGHYDRLIRDDGDKQADDRITAPEVRGKDTLRITTANLAVRAEPDTIRFSFFQVEGKTDTVLRIDNGYKQSLIYSAGLSRPANNGIYPTNVCPVGGGRIVTEGWPEPLSLLVLRDFKLTDAKPAQTADDCH